VALPTKLRILGHDVSIKLVGRPLHHARQAECDYENCVIRIAENMHNSIKRVCLLHEVIHLISDAQDLGLSEEQVTSLAQGLYQVIADNGNFITERKK
jgi:hypothetical protein